MEAADHMATQLEFLKLTLFLFVFVLARRPFKTLLSDHAAKPHTQNEDRRNVRSTYVHCA